MDEIIDESSPKWKNWLVIGFTVIAVSGMMYMLFTDEKYNRFGGGPGTADSATVDTATSMSGGYTSTENDSAASPGATKQNSATTTTPEVKPVVVEQPKAVVTTPPVTKTVAPASPVTKPQTNDVKPMVTAPPKIPVATNPVPTVKPEVKADKVMTDAELQQLVSNILEKGNAEGVYAKCVQLRNTADGNNKTTVKQIEAYLRSQKFTIAGRQTISSSQKGIQVAAGDGCMRLTVGSF